MFGLGSKMLPERGLRSRVLSFKVTPFHGDDNIIGTVVL